MHRQTTTHYCAVRAGNMDHITAAILTPVGKTESMQIVDVPEAVEMVSPADTISASQMSPIQTPVLEEERVEEMADTDFRQVMEAEAKESLQDLGKDYREETLIEVMERDEAVSESCPLESDGPVGLAQHPGEPVTFVPDQTCEQPVEAVALPVEATASTSVVATASAVMTAIGSPRRANSSRTSIPALRSIYRQQQHLAPLGASTPATNHLHQRPLHTNTPVVVTNADSTISTTTPNPVPATRTATSTSVQKRSSLAEVKARLSNIAAASSPTISASLPVSSTSTFTSSSLLSPTTTIENKKGSPLYQERLQKLRSVNPVAVMGSPKRSLRRRPSVSRISEKELSSMTVTSSTANEMPNIKSTETSIDVSETNPSVLPATPQTLYDQLASPMAMLTLPMRILLSVVVVQALLLCYLAVSRGDFGSTPVSTTTTAKFNEIVNPPNTQQYPHYKVLSMMTNPASTLDGLNIPIQLLIEPAEQQLRRSSRSHRSSSFDGSVSGSTYHQCLRWVTSSVQPELDLTVLNSTTASNSGAKESSSKEVVSGSILRGVAQWFLSQQFRVHKLLSRLFQRRTVLPTIEAPPKMEVASSNTTNRSNRTVFGSLRPSDCSAMAYSSADSVVDDRTHNWWRILPISADTPLSLVSLHDSKSSEVDPVPFLLQHVGEGLCLSTQIVTSTVHAPATDLSEDVQTAVLDAIMGSLLPRQQQPLTRSRTGSLASVPLSTLQSFESSNHNRADNTDYSNEDASGMSLLLHPSTETVLTTCDPSHPSTVWTLQQNRLMAHQLDRMVDTKTDSEQTQKTTYHTVWAWEASYRGLAVSLQQEQQHQVDATVDTLHQDFMPTKRLDGELEVSIGLNTWGRKVSHDSESESHREIYGLQRQQFDSIIQ